MARKVAGEAIVLLENDGVLPLNTRHPIAMYGSGVTNTVKGGSGSGEVNERYSVSIFDGMKNAGFQILNDDLLLAYREKAGKARTAYRDKMIQNAGFMNMKVVSMAHMFRPFVNPAFGLIQEEDIKACDACIYVISRISGEGFDRSLEKGDYMLSEEESANIRFLSRHYQHLILVLNAGGPLDLSSVDDVKISALLFVGMLGEEGGNAFADVISGKISPSGHLADTWPKKYKDVPFGNTFSGMDGALLEDEYKEDIYVGYRYYQRFGKEVRYPFGYGCSYSAFSMQGHCQADEVIRITVDVQNVGQHTAKALAQIYISEPEDKLCKAESVLAGYAKTGVLQPGKKQRLFITVPYHYIASFDESRAAYILEKGQYLVFLGENVRDKKTIGAFRLDEEVILSAHKHICAPKKKVKCLTPNEKKAEAEIDPCLYFSADPSKIKPETGVRYPHSLDAYRERAEKIVNGLSLRELSKLLVGNGTTDFILPGFHHLTVPGATGYSTNKLGKKGIADIAYADGPAGLRLINKAVVKKKKVYYINPVQELVNYLPRFIKLLSSGKESDGPVLYQYTTAFPTGMAIAQTWNEELVSSVGEAVGNEMKEYGVCVWLAPGANIHRNPLCGRNYEYYSEDPLLTGKTAAAMIRGIQSNKGKYATIKHFFCNNQENERQWINAVVSERAIREIYVKGFGIAIKEGQGKALMSSYNKINGVWSGVCKDALTTLLREEWQFDGLVVTDWDGSHEGLEAEVSIDAGVTMLMGGSPSQSKAIYKALKEKRLDERIARERAIANAQFILQNQDVYGIV